MEGMTLSLNQGPNCIILFVYVYFPFYLDCGYIVFLVYDLITFSVSLSLLQFFDP